MRLQPGTTIGRYRIVAQLGAGGMGEVYRAEDSSLEREVAIKVMPGEFERDADRVARFHREAKAVARLSHPNILSIWDFGTEDGVTYAVTELLEGGTLRETMAEGAMPPERVASMGAAIAHGLAAAHGKGVIHRDLKPENLFVADDGQLKILDFGLARISGPLPEEGDVTRSMPAAQTSPGTVLGTLGYMAPEQVRGQVVDHRADIFSLGCVLYEMLSGRRAFRRDSSADTMAAILTMEPPPLEVVDGGGAPELEQVIRRCLEKKVEDRFESADELRAVLEGIVRPTSGDQDIQQSRSGTSASGTSRKRLAIVLALAAVVLIFVAVLWQATKGDVLEFETWDISQEQVVRFQRLDAAVSNYWETKVPGPSYRQTEAALGQLNALAADGVQDPAVAYYRGRCLFDLGRYSEAEKLFAATAGDEGAIWRIQSQVRANKISEASEGLKEFRRSARTSSYVDEFAVVEAALDELNGGMQFETWLNLQEMDEQQLGTRAEVARLQRLADEAPSAGVEARLAAQLMNRDPEQAMEHIALALELEPGNRDALELRSMQAWDSGDHRAAVADLERVVEHHGADLDVAYNLACGHALLGQQDEAFDWLGTALRLGFSDFDHLRRDSDLESLRKDPRFAELLFRFDR